MELARKGNMSNQEPDGWATTSPEGEYTGNDDEIILTRVDCELVEDGYRTFPVCLIDPQELSRLRAIEADRQKEIDELREQVKWWASKWVQISKKNSENEDYLELNALYDFRLELDAAAARVMGK